MPPFAKINFAPAAVDARSLPSGGMILRSAQRLEPYARSLGDILEHWAVESPDGVFLAERAPSGAWRRISYAQSLKAVRSIGQALLQRKLSADRPVVILSDNGIDHALLALGAMHVGVPVSPISSAYSLISKDYEKLRYALGLIEPGLIFAADGAPFAPALRKVGIGQAELLVGANPPEGIEATAFTELLDTPAGSAVDEALAKVGPDTIAKILFSSGSTDLPKGVVVTQRMMCSNQQALSQVWPFLSSRPPVLVDWLPWNHIFGGNFCFNMILRHGGTLYIDDGKPTPQRIQKTVANLHEISPTLYLNVPLGFDMLLPFLERDEGLRNNFFRHLDALFYAAAALPQNLWKRLEDVAVAARGERVPMVSAWGSTETAPAVTAVHFEIERAGVIGLPLPGCEVKMEPNAGKLELRLKGPNVTPGYWNHPEATAAEITDGWLHTGDATRQDDDGYYYIVDRWKDMYISGGENVYPAEVEDVIFQLPGIVEAAVIGVSDERWVEVGKAVIVLQEGASLDESEVLRHCAKNLAKFKVPKSVVFIDALPRNATGKILKRELRAQFDPAKS